MNSHYQNHRLEDIHHLKKIFPTGEADDLNWCLLSTSGVHGLYRTLDDIEHSDAPTAITVLVIQPRLASTLYGHIDIEKEDILFLRKLVNSSLKHIQASQKGNDNI